MTISGGRTKQLIIFLPRHWLYKWFSQFHSCGTYSVLLRSHSILYSRSSFTGTCVNFQLNQSKWEMICCMFCWNHWNLHKTCKLLQFLAHKWPNWI